MQDKPNVLIRMKPGLKISFIFLIVLAVSSSKRRTLKKKNVLFIMVDDLRPQLGCYYGDSDFPDNNAKKPKTPNIDKLAEKSLLLKRAYAQVALCGPSRASILTGRRPETTRQFTNREWYRSPTRSNFTTLPQFFKEKGYTTLGMGKIFHMGQDPFSWSEPFFEIERNDNVKGYTWAAMDDDESRRDDLHDEIVTRLALESLERVAKDARKGIKPFFLAAGFWKPHLPFAIPSRFYRDYPMDDVKLPKNQFVPKGMPEYEWFKCKKLPSDKQVKFEMNFNITLPKDLVLNLRRAYYGCVTYIDTLVGILLKKLDKLRLTKNTVVALIGDHGWQLGEHNMWCKQSNMEVGTHSPMIIHIPRKTNDGVVSRNLVELIDLFPTLVEATGFPPLQTCTSSKTKTLLCSEGSSLMPLVKKPNLKNWKKAAFSQFTQDERTMGYSIRTDRYRYTEWVPFSVLYSRPDWSIVKARELYDHDDDADENQNVADKRRYAAVVEDLGHQLRAGWRGALPQ